MVSSSALAASDGVEPSGWIDDVLKPAIQTIGPIAAHALASW
jgi:hypothetical protein